MKFLCGYIALSLIFLKSCHFYCSFNLESSFIHDFTVSIKFFTNGDHWVFIFKLLTLFLNGNVINESHMMNIFEHELWGLYSVSLHFLEWKITSYVEFVKRSIRNIF